MPTGYTAEVMDGITTTFKRFALSCARAFGVTINLELQDKIEPTPYCKGRLDEARDTLSSLEKMSYSEATSMACKEYHAAVAAYNSACADKERVRNRYEHMLSEATKWEPPSQDHVNMKEFMISQLQDSIRQDCPPEPGAPPVRLSAEEWLAENKSEALRDIEYWGTRTLEEFARAEKSTRWIRELKESL